MDHSKSHSDSSLDESPSPYSHILHTNYAPSDSELLEIQTYLVDSRSKLHRLEAELARIRALLADITSEHDRLQNFVNAHDALLSPIRRVPPEILQDIFVCCLHATRNSVMHRSEAPLLLTEICKDWRRIALSTPALWASLHLVYLRPALTVARFDSVKAWLARSGALPLSISVYQDQVMDPKTFPPMTEVLGQSIYRCSRLQLTAPNLLPHLEQLKSAALPFLEDIDLYAQRLPPNLRDDSLSFLRNSPSLRRVTLRGTINLSPLPLVKLEELKLHLDSPFHYNELSRILRRCHNLQSFSLSMPDSPMDLNIPYDGECITLPHLQVFHILSGDEMLQGIFQHVILPQVRDLSIERSYIRYMHVQLPTLLASMLSRSACMLKKIRLRPVETSQTDLIACLSLVPSVTDLHILQATESLNDTFIDSITRTSDATCLCPNLQRITLQYYSGSFDTLVKFIRSRSKPSLAARLVYAHIISEKYVDDPTAMSQLDTFRDEGLDITVTFPPKCVPWYSSPEPWSGLPSDSNVPIFFQ